MTFLAAIVKWALENPKLFRVLLIALAAGFAALWFHHQGARSAASTLRAREQTAVLHIKEQYDEISNHRIDNHGLLELLRAGRF